MESTGTQDEAYDHWLVAGKGGEGGGSSLWEWVMEMRQEGLPCGEMLHLYWGAAASPFSTA